MKKLYFSLLVFSFFTSAKAQIVNIPDANFKARLIEANTTNTIAKNLLGDFFKIDANNDGEIQESEALQVSSINFGERVGYNMLSLMGIEKFTNLKYLYCSGSPITNSNIKGLTKLEGLVCEYCNLTTLDISSLKNLKFLGCRGNKLTNLDLRGLTNLEELVCNANQLTSINLTGLINLNYLRCENNQLKSLNLNGLTKLVSLYCKINQLTSLDLTGLTSFKLLSCSNNNLKSLEINGLYNLESLDCGFNQLTRLDLLGLNNLQKVYCNNNQLTSLNLNGLVNLETLRVSENKLVSIFIKNCNKIDFNSTNSIEISLFWDSNLRYVCANEDKLDLIRERLIRAGNTTCIVNSDCNVTTPNGINYIIKGKTTFDSDNNGCNMSDGIFSNFNFIVKNSANNIIGSYISDETGTYSILAPEESFLVTPFFENSGYFTISPTSVNVNFPTQTSPFTQDFCITPNGVHPDLEITLLPLQPARPGFDAKYRLVYKNKGNQLQSGTVTLDFNDAVLDLAEVNPIQTSQNATSLSWSFSDLQPFETREISFTMNVNSPQEIPAVINEDVLAYTATITSSATDETPSDNTFTFNQIVVGSYDPNDKTCLEGTVITPNLIGQYVHYMIRFENTGTFAAENVVVKDMIDLTKFDISTLVPTSASHSFTTRISEGNKVEFIFENINLPFDDVDNDGYVAFKIKTKPTLKVGDSIENEASIFFDFNFPIITEPAISTFRNPVTADFDFDAYFSAYPIPANQVLNLIPKKAINIDSISIYNNLGQMVLVITKASKVPNIDVSSLSAGNYFIKITTDKGITSSRFVKE